MRENKKKINLIVATYFRANYGSTLQAFSLKKCLEEYGINSAIVEICRKIDFLLPIRYIYRFLRPERNYSYAKKTKRILQQRKYKNKFLNINRFCNENLDVLQVENEKDIQKKYGYCNCYLAGSDQIWNSMDHDIRPIYKLSYLSENCKKFSYAASTGVEKLNKNSIDKYEEFLEDFETVSFREKNVAKQFENILNEVRCDLDPTLLYTRDFWVKYSKKPNNYKKFIFIYMLRPQKKIFEIAEKIAKRENLEIIYTGQYAHNIKNIFIDYDCGIEQFLGYINSAKYVLTNSFHGTVFSTIFHKQFISFKIESTGARAENYLKMINLSERRISIDDDYAIIYEDINYREVDNYIDKYRTESRNYIKNIAKSILAEY